MAHELNLNSQHDFVFLAVNEKETKEAKFDLLHLFKGDKHGLGASIKYKALIASGIFS